jgi:hypothetical protein
MAAIPVELARDLPETLDELVHALETGHATEDGLVPLSYRFAEALGALRRCDECARPIVDVEVMATLLMEHYAADLDERPAIEDALRESQLETGDTLTPSRCSYHGQLPAE